MGVIDLDTAEKVRQSQRESILDVAIRAGSLVGCNAASYVKSGYLQLACTPARMQCWAYKVMLGDHKGAVVKVNKISNLIIEDGRYFPNTSYGHRTARWVGMTSYDADGIDYVNRMIRPHLGILDKISRMYRPKGSNGHYAYVDIYFADARN